MNRLSNKKNSLAILAALSLAACSNLQPEPFSAQALSEQGRADLAAAQFDVEPLTGELSLDQAIARALKYNLDRRARMMEEASPSGSWRSAATTCCRG